MLALVAAPSAPAQAPVIAEPAAADSAEAASERGVQRARIKLELEGAHRGRVDVGERLKVIGKIRPFVRNQRLSVYFKKGSRILGASSLKIQRVPHTNTGRFVAVSRAVISPGKYKFVALKPRTEEQAGDYARSKSIGVDYPDLDPGDNNSKVRLFNRLLRKKAYHSPSGSSYGDGMGRAVLAFHKVNNLVRSTNATAGDFKRLAAGRGGFKPKWSSGGKHVEVDLSRQVMVLARGGKPQHIFHISSGAPATPTIRGKTTFFRKQPGTNSKGMVHSVYFGPTNRGYATHGYASVPTYPASHGCVRNPIPNSLFIYNWIDLGDGMFVYG
jgi:hypothetical protein